MEKIPVLTQIVEKAAELLEVGIAEVGELRERIKREQGMTQLLRPALEAVVKAWLADEEHSHLYEAWKAKIDEECDRGKTGLYAEAREMVDTLHEHGASHCILK